MRNNAKNAPFTSPTQETQSQPCKQGIKRSTDLFSATQIKLKCHQKLARAALVHNFKRTKRGQISPIAGAACHDCHAPTRKPPSFLLNLYSSANVLCYMLTTWPDPFNRQQQICVDSNTRLLCAHYAAALT